jgi:hypothetical protein
LNWEAETGDATGCLHFFFAERIEKDERFSHVTLLPYLLRWRQAGIPIRCAYSGHETVPHIRFDSPGWDGVRWLASVPKKQIHSSCIAGWPRVDVSRSAGGGGSLRPDGRLAATAGEKATGELEQPAEDPPGFWATIYPTRNDHKLTLLRATDNQGRDVPCKNRGGGQSVTAAGLELQPDATSVDLVFAFHASRTVTFQVKPEFYRP